MPKKNSEINMDKFVKFIEELSWLLDAYKDLKMENHVEEIKRMLNQGEQSILSEAVRERENAEKRELVGIFPDLFQNKKLFPSNQTIIEFSNEVLRTNINPSKNRSKNEIIGEIVCTTYSLSNKEMKKVVSALEKVVDSEKVVERVKSLKEESSFSWNEIIQKLAE